MRRAPLCGAAALWLVCCAGAASAESTAAAGVAAGARHVVGELDHLLAVVALGLLTGQVGGRALVWTPAALAVGLVAGAHSGAVLSPLARVEAVNLCSLAILGALVALRLPLPAMAPVVGGLTFGWSHGYANVLDLGGRTPAPAFVVGIVVGALAVVAAASLPTTSWRTGWQQVAVRAVGSWICAIGTMVLALHLAGA